MYGKAVKANSIKASSNGSNTLKIPPRIFSNPMNKGCSFFIAVSDSLNAATNPPTAATTKPIPVAFKAEPNDCVATLALFNPAPSIPIGPPADSSESIQSLETFFADLILSSKSSI